MARHRPLEHRHHEAPRPVEDDVAAHLAVPAGRQAGGWVRLWDTPASPAEMLAALASQTTFAKAGRPGGTPRLNDVQRVVGAREICIVRATHGFEFRPPRRYPGGAGAGTQRCVGHCPAAETQHKKGDTKNPKKQIQSYGFLVSNGTKSSFGNILISKMFVFNFFSPKSSEILRTQKKKTLQMQKKASFASPSPVPRSSSCQ